MANEMKHIFRKIYNFSKRDKSLVFESKLLLPSFQRTWENGSRRVYSWLLQPKTQASLSTQLTTEGLSSLEEQDFSFLILPPDAQLLRLSPGWIQLRSRGSPFGLTPMWNRGSTFNVAYWEFYEDIPSSGSWDSGSMPGGNEQSPRTHTHTYTCAPLSN